MRILLKLLAALAVLFVLLRLVSPSLMNVKNDLAFWAGVACWPAAAVIAILAGSWIYRDLAPLPRRKGELVRFPRRRKPEDNP